MTMQDPISDMLTRIRNGQAAKKKTVSFQFSKLKQSISSVLYKEGYIKNYSLDQEKKTIMIELKYSQGSPVIEKIQRVSRPGQRVYKKSKKIKKVMHGFGIFIISSSKGVMTDNLARKKKVGGEVLCYVY